MVINFSDVKDISNKLIVDVWDHNFLNDLVPFLTTVENLTKHVYDVLIPEIPSLYKVRLCETETCWGEYEELKGEKNKNV